MIFCALAHHLMQLVPFVIVSPLPVTHPESATVVLINK